MVRFSPLAVAKSGIGVPVTTLYHLNWRPRASQPWQTEEYANRFEAHCKYFALLARGVEVSLEIRRLTGE